MRLAREHRLVVPLVRSLWNQGISLHEMGEDDRALAALGEGLALAERAGDDALIPRVRNTIGFLRMSSGDFDAGIDASERAYAETNDSSRADRAAVRSKSIAPTAPQAITHWRWSRQRSRSIW